MEIAVKIFVTVLIIQILWILLRAPGYFITSALDISIKILVPSFKLPPIKFLRNIINTLIGLAFWYCLLHYMYGNLDFQTLLQGQIAVNKDFIMEYSYAGEIQEAFDDARYQLERAL